MSRVRKLPENIKWNPKNVAKGIFSSPYERRKPTAVRFDPEIHVLIASHAMKRGISFAGAVRELVARAFR